MGYTKYGYIGGVEPEQGGNNNKGVFSTSEVQDLVLDQKYGIAQITRGLVFNYDAKLNGMSGSSVIDSSGNSLNATAYNGLSVSTSSSVDYGGAFVFDSSNDYMQRSYSSTYMSGWTSNQTISLWFRSSDMSGRRNLWNQSYGGLGTMTHETGDTINYYYGTNGNDGVDGIDGGMGQGSQGPKGDPGDAICQETELPPNSGERGKLWIDGVNQIIVTLG